MHQKYLQYMCNLDAFLFEGGVSWQNSQMVGIYSLLSFEPQLHLNHN